ncbi:MAG: ParB/RepB/Spo0J family partition protein [Fimbriimonadaceae bacterium]|nr:ParB/RepB/Spo0J family partition protein [Chitinophagales bacterium]
MSKKLDLGKGIRALLENMDAETSELVEKTRAEVSSTNFISLEAIEINPFQPRADFDEEALQELASSIKVHGIIQPVTVRKLNATKYQLISGERRLRAAKIAGLKEIPAYVRNANDQEMLEIALIENIQREDLNAMEISIHFRRLLDECDLTHEQLADRLGKNRTTITNFLRLLKLPPDIQNGLKQKKITMGHARALINLDDPVGQIAIYKDIIQRNLTVRDVEDIVRDFQNSKSKSAGGKGLSQKTIQSSHLPYEFRKIQDELSSNLGTRVIVKRNKTGKGEIVISFFSDDDLYRIKEILD